MVPIAVELGTGYVTLTASAKGLGDDIAKGFGSDLDKHANDAGDRAGRGFTDKFKVGLGGVATAVGGAFAAVQVGSFLKGSVDAASDLGESLSKVNIVFGDGADTIVEWSKTAASSLGQSQQQALEAAGTYGNLFSAMGIGTDTSADMSKSLVTLAGDLASFNNANPEDVLLALRSGLSGEAEPLKQFGVNINEVRIKAEALRLGLAKTSVDQGKLSAATENADKAQRKSIETLTKFGAESVQYTDAVRDQEQAESKLAVTLDGKMEPLDAAAKAQASYSLILADTALAQGDFSRTSGGLANQSRILSAKFEDLKAKIGTALLPVVQGFVSFLGDKMIPAFENLGEKVGPILTEIVGGFKAFFAAFKAGDGDVTSSGFPGFMEKLANTVRDLAGTFMARVMPVLRQFGVFLRDDLGRAVVWLGDVFQSHILPALQAVGSFIVGTIIPGIISLGKFVNENREILVGVAVAIGTLLVPAFLLWAVGAAAAAVSTIVALAPIIAIGVAIAALVAGIIWAYQNWEFFRVAVDAVGSFLRDVLWPIIKQVADVIKDALVAQFQATIIIAGKVWEAIKTVADWLGPKLKVQIDAAIEGVKTLIGWFAAIIDAAVNVYNSAKEKFDALLAVITGLPGAISSAASGMFDGIKNAFRSAINFIIDGWNSLSFSIPGFDPPGPGPSFGGVTINTPQIPRLAKGALVSTPMIAQIGEAGREIVAPDNLIRQIVREEAGGAGATFNNVFNGTRVNARDVSGEIAWQLRGIL